MKEDGGEKSERRGKSGTTRDAKKELFLPRATNPDWIRVYSVRRRLSSPCLATVCYVLLIDLPAESSIFWNLPCSMHMRSSRFLLPRLPRLNIFVTHAFFLCSVVILNAAITVASAESSYVLVVHLHASPGLVPTQRAVSV